MIGTAVDLRTAARNCLEASIAAGHLPGHPSTAVIAHIADVLGSTTPRTRKTPSVELDVLNGENGVAATTRRF